MEMNKLNKIQNKHFVDLYLENYEQSFAYFLSEHPNLYAGVNLTGTEIDYVNNHFWLYNVEPQTFEIEFMQALREAVPRYNNMKAVELCDEIFTVVTDKTTRHLISDATNNLQRNNTVTRSENTTSNNDNRFADRRNPMGNSGRTFDETVEWTKGATNINQNKSTSYNVVSANDIQALTDNGTNHGNEWETIDRTKEAPVDVVERIWNYLLKPKSLEYLTSALAKCFILVY